MKIQQKEKNPVPFKGRKTLDNKLGKPKDRKDPNASMPRKKDAVDKE